MRSVGIGIVRESCRLAPSINGTGDRGVESSGRVLGAASLRYVTALGVASRLRRTCDARGASTSSGARRSEHAVAVATDLSLLATLLTPLLTL